MRFERRRTGHHLQLPDPMALDQLAGLLCRVAQQAPHLVGVLIWAVTVSSKAVTKYRREAPSVEDVDALLDHFPEARGLIGGSRPGRGFLERRDPKRDLRRHRERGLSTHRR